MMMSIGFPVVNDPLYNHEVFGAEKGKGGRIGKSDDQLIQDLISIHNAENWLGMDDDLGGPISNSASSTTKADNKLNRSDTPDSASAELTSAADSPSSSSSAASSEYQMDNVGTSTAAIGSKRSSGLMEEKVTIATQTGIEEADKRFDVSKLSVDPHCYECKVKYRDPRPKDLVMFLHAWAYSVRFAWLARIVITVFLRISFLVPKPKIKPK